MSSMKRKYDVLACKQRELDGYVMQSNAAVSFITNAIDGMQTVNEQIKSKIAEIDAYQAELSETRHGLEDTMSRNERFMKNARALFE